MSTLEKTISMMETLPEADLVKIQDLIQTLFHQRECEMADDMVGNILKPMSRKDFMNDVKTAEEEIADRKYVNAEEMFDELGQRYNF